jgi:hypothetical protein
MRCFAPIQTVIPYNLADLFLELKALDYRRAEVQNMGEVKMTFHKFTKSHFYGTAYKLLSDVNFLSRCFLIQTFYYRKENSIFFNFNTLQVLGYPY